MLLKFMPAFAAFTLFAGFLPAAAADPPANLADNTRYLALGDSLTAGYGAMPVSQGYAYQLYQQGIYDDMPNTLFANAAVPGAPSAHVLGYQVPMAVQSGFEPHVITMTVGGNDLLQILAGSDPHAVLASFQGNLVSILTQLCTALPDTRLYIGNLYEIAAFPIPTADAVNAFNQVVAGVVGFANAVSCQGRARVADVHAQFAGPQDGLLLINRNGAGLFEPHPTNAGYRAMARAFIAAR